MSQQLQRRLSAKIVLAAFLAALFFGFSWTVFHRYPLSDEIALRYSLPSHTSVTVDDTQSDIGYFGITRVGPEGREEFFVETFPQWVFPWQHYDWSIYD